MTRVAVRIQPTDRLEDARAAMEAHHVAQVPVFDGERLSGILTERDVAYVSSFLSDELSTLTVSDVMTRETSSVTPDAFVVDVAKDMIERRYSCAVVMDGTGLVGVFTASDALRALVHVPEFPHAS